jgi:hypothetical protein
MIIQAILNVVYNVLAFLLGLLPLVDQSLVTAIHTNTAQLKALIEAANWIFPVDILFLYFWTLVLILGAIFTFKVAREILRNITGGIVK